MLRKASDGSHRSTARRRSLRTEERTAPACLLLFGSFARIKKAPLEKNGLRLAIEARPAYNRG
ncbi:hypothetical protein CDO73_04545 [Saccharibacillus sp. O23]|nr:hypothetical protein CDO73_04545 [Saccharibacillus sp. O23]